MSWDIWPTFDEIVEVALAWFQRDLHTALPGRVVKYNAAEKTANIEVQVKRLLYFPDGSVDTSRTEAFPILPRVPVGQPAGGGYFMHMPVAVGDFVWVHVAERSLDRYRRYGRADAPADERLHHLQHAFAYPMFDPAKMRTVADFVENKLVIGKAGGGPVIAVDENHVNLGDAAATAAVSRADKTDTEIERIWTLLTSWVVSPNDGGAALQAAAKLVRGIAPPGPDQVQSTAATKVKAT